MTIKSKYLEQLLNDFELLSEIVLSQINMTRTLMLFNTDNERNVELYETIERNEKLIDGLDLEIREGVINAIFLFTPRAADLRKIIAYHNMTNYLERVGDLALNVAHFIKKICITIDEFSNVLDKLYVMFQQTQLMLKNAIISFSCEDSSTAYETISMDDVIDGLYKEITTLLAESFKDKPLSEQELKNMMFLNSISYNIERIADNATNIAESAIYLTDGKDIRHRN